MRATFLVCTSSKRTCQKLRAHCENVIRTFGNVWPKLLGLLHQLHDAGSEKDMVPSVRNWWPVRGHLQHRSVVVPKSASSVAAVPWPHRINVNTSS